MACSQCPRNPWAARLHTQLGLWGGREWGFLVRGPFSALWAFGAGISVMVPSSLKGVLAFIGDVMSQIVVTAWGLEPQWSLWEPRRRGD